MNGFRRRHLLRLTATAVLARERGAAGQVRKAPRRGTLTIGMRSSGEVTVNVPAPTTFMATLPIETGTTALRVGFANIHGQPYDIAGVCVCEGTGWKANQSSGWAYFSFAGGGGTVTPAARPVPVRVQGNTINQTGSRFVPAITWSDWIAYRTAAPRPQLVFRTLVPAQNEVPMAFPAGPGVISRAAGGLPDRLIEQASVAGDYVGQPEQDIPAPAATKLSPVYVVQYRAVRPGYQVIIGGDSQFAMSSTFAQLAATQLSTPERPFAVWDTAWAQPSKTFWPALDQAIAAAPPSVTVIQGWTANDGMTPAADQTYLARVKESAERTLAAGGMPIIVKGLPRDLFGKPELASWQNVNRRLDTLLPGALVFDPLPYVEDPAAPGNWLSALSNDGLHPNGLGNLTLRGPFERLIAPLLA